MGAAVMRKSPILIWIKMKKDIASKRAGKVKPKDNTDAKKQKSKPVSLKKKLK